MINHRRNFYNSHIVTSFFRKVNKLCLLTSKYFNRRKCNYIWFIWSDDGEKSGIFWTLLRSRYLKWDTAGWRNNRDTIIPMVRGLLCAHNLDNWPVLACAYPARIIANVINAMMMLSHWTQYYALIRSVLTSVLTTNWVLNLKLNRRDRVNFEFYLKL